MTESIYKNKMELMEKHKDTLAAIEKANPKKEDGTPYDMGVCFDMLVADYKAKKGEQELPYSFEGSDEFDWDAFGKEYEAL